MVTVHAGMTEILDYQVSSPTKFSRVLCLQICFKERGATDSGKQLYQKLLRSLRDPKKCIRPDGMYLRILRVPVDVTVRLMFIVETLKKSADWRLLQILHPFSELAAPIFKKKSNSCAVNIILALGKITRQIFLGTIPRHMKEKKITLKYEAYLFPCIYNCDILSLTVIRILNLLITE